MCDAYLHQVYSGNRKCVMFHPVPLDFVKILKNELNVSLNDIMLVAISQAIRNYCLHRKCGILKEKGVKVRCRATMSVAVADGSRDRSSILSNKW